MLAMPLLAGSLSLWCVLQGGEIHGQCGQWGLWGLAAGGLSTHWGHGQRKPKCDEDAEGNQTTTGVPEQSTGNAQYTKSKPRVL